ncbi:MAG TPA: hypothetical protein VNQ78_08415 [Paracoccus sp. (in: a-proteobacteria)]|uniref:hypothetical protein n=1 Tax=Paracoccus sp. TaxID=267 RepID=UPI002C884C5C|nr:hypothetical protein [Paracoccus sp. (in: a-proteobacteria)]HWL56684.1 hypothetical protein [Paracoccus sp. (in: a-proteobacteria)]
MRQAANRAEREALRQERQAIRQQEREARRASRVTGKELPSGARGRAGGEPAAFNILVIAQKGRLAREALLFAASLRRNAPDWRGRLIIAEPRADGAWAGADVALTDAERAALAAFGAEITPFTAQHFGQGYPHGNKIEALSVLPAGAPFVFFDSDTLVTGELAELAIDFSRPTASMRRTGTWPEPPLYGPGYSDIWRSLYDRFGLDFASSLDKTQPDEHWERYLYFNAGWFLGPDPRAFGERFLDFALGIRDEPGEALACQSVEVLLDQVALPLVIHALGGGRPGPELDGLDGAVTCHYRDLALLYAREDDRAVNTLEALMRQPPLSDRIGDWPMAQDFVVNGVGRDRIRPMFDRSLPLNEGRTRQQLKKQGLWKR